MHTLILGLGNPLRGDDGVGSAVIANLRNHPDLPPDVDLVDGGTAGLETAVLLQSRQKVIIIDAADMDSPPGTWRRFTLAEAQLLKDEAQMRGTLHNVGLAEALALAEVLQIMPQTLIIFGVQPENVDWEEGLSTAVTNCIPNLCTRILQDASIREFHSRGVGHE